MAGPQWALTLRDFRGRLSGRIFCTASCGNAYKLSHRPVLALVSEFAESVIFTAYEHFASARSLPGGLNVGIVGNGEDFERRSYRLNERDKARESITSLGRTPYLSIQNP